MGDKDKDKECCSEKPKNDEEECQSKEGCC